MAALCYLWCVCAYSFAAYSDFKTRVDTKWNLETLLTIFRLKAQMDDIRLEVVDIGDMPEQLRGSAEAVAALVTVVASSLTLQFMHRSQVLKHVMAKGKYFVAHITLRFLWRDRARFTSSHISEAEACQ